MNAHTISVTATGSVKAVPDTLSMSVVIRRTASSTEQASKEVDEIVVTAVASLIAAGVSDKHIDTSRIRSKPEFKYGQSGNRYVGEMVEQVVEFYTHNLDLLGEIYSKLSLLPLHRIDNPRVKHSNHDELERQALRAAVRLGRAKARDMASEAGLRIGEALSLTDRQSYTSEFDNGRIFEGPPSEGAPKHHIGFTEREISAGVEMVFELLPGATTD